MSLYVSLEFSRFCTKYFKTYFLIRNETFWDWSHSKLSLCYATRWEEINRRRTTIDKVGSAGSFHREANEAKVKNEYFGKYNRLGCPHFTRLRIGNSQEQYRFELKLLFYSRMPIYETQIYQTFCSEAHQWEKNSKIIRDIDRCRWRKNQMLH